MAGSCFLSSGNKMYRLSTYLMAKNGKEGGSITFFENLCPGSFHNSDCKIGQGRADLGTYTCPSDLLPNDIDGLENMARQRSLLQSWKYHPEKSPWSSLGLCESFRHRRVVVGCLVGTCQRKGHCLGDDVSIPKSENWLHQGVDVVALNWRIQLGRHWLLVGVYPAVYRIGNDERLAKSEVRLTDPWFGARVVTAWSQWCVL